MAAPSDMAGSEAAAPAVLPYLELRQDLVDWNPWILRAGIVYAAASLVGYASNFLQSHSSQQPDPARGPWAIATLIFLVIADLTLLIGCVLGLVQRIRISAARAIVLATTLGVGGIHVAWYVLEFSRVRQGYPGWRFAALIVQSYGESARFLLWPVVMLLTLRPRPAERGSPVLVRMLYGSIALALLDALLEGFSIIWPLLSGEALLSILDQVRGSIISAARLAAGPLALAAAALCVVALCSCARRRILVTVAMWLLVIPPVIRLAAGIMQIWRSPGAGASLLIFDTFASLMRYTTASLVIVVLAMMLWRRPRAPSAVAS
jgi:hypothetical protein